MMKAIAIYLILLGLTGTVCAQKKQACLGMINVCLDYRPKIYNLNHLLSLCDMISADFEEIIPRNTREDKCYYKIMANGVSDIRDHDHAEHDTSILQLLYNRCLNFVAKAKALSELRLNNLYMFHMISLCHIWIMAS
jgi:hypothetical protein